MGAALACAAGCKSENELRYTATLQSETSGVAMSDDGLDAYAGMAGTTCTIDVNWGCPTDDADLPTDTEHVVDHLGSETLGISNEGMHVIDGGLYVPDADVVLGGIRTAGITTAGGHVIVAQEAEGCTVVRDGASLLVPDEACAEDARYALDRDGETLFVASAGKLLALEGGVARDVGVTGDLVSWDPALGVLYTAEVGDTTLRALDATGAEVWSVEARGPIMDLAARGTRGEVLALVGHEALASLERRDGENGRMMGDSPLPTDDGHIVVSLNGIKVAVIRDDEVAFFALDPEGEDPVVDPTPPVCIDPLDRAQRD